MLVPRGQRICGGGSGDALCVADNEALGVCEKLGDVDCDGEPVPETDAVCDCDPVCACVGDGLWVAESVRACEPVPVGEREAVGV